MNVFARACVLSALAAGLSACTSLTVPRAVADSPERVSAQYRLLFSRDASKRCDAAYELGRLGSDAAPAVPRLVQMLTDETSFPLPDNGLDGPFSRTPSSCAEEALYAIGEPAVLALIPMLKHPLARVRARAAYALARIGDPRSVKAVRAAFWDNSVDVRQTVVLWAGNLDPRSLDAYIAALKDRDSEVRLQAARRIGMFHDPRETDVLLSMLRSKDPDIQVSAALSLGSIQDARIRPALTASLSDPNEYVRADSALSLGALGDREAVEGLLTTLREDPSLSVRYAATEALGTLGDPRAVEPIIAALSSNDFVQRKVAAEALGKLGDARAIEPLQALLTDTYPAVRESARQALNALQNDR